jgi:hypothetical protein
VEVDLAALCELPEVDIEFVARGAPGAVVVADM